VGQSSRETFTCVDIAKIPTLKVELSPITSTEPNGPDEKYLFFENLVRKSSYVNVSDRKMISRNWQEDSVTTC
jgi:hypothetical protein